MDHLFEAISSKDTQTVAHIVSAGVNVNTRDSIGQTPLLHACRRSTIEIVNLLIDAGADVNISEKKRMDSVALCSRDHNADVDSNSYSGRGQCKCGNL